MPKTNLWLIGGFLGSGKTTVLNSLLSVFGSSAGKTGVIVNDFGDLGVDASLVATDNEPEVTELNGGQIFCACLSGSFVSAIGALVERGVVTILVEASGLAKPSAMDVILREANAVASGNLWYRGMVCVVDAQRWSKLRAVVNAVEEQVVKADLVLINKSDLVSSDVIDMIKNDITELNPTSSILATEHGHLDPADLPGAPRTEAIPGLSRFTGWDGAGRPNTGTFTPDRPVSNEEIRLLLQQLSTVAYRAKGYLADVEHDWLVSASGEQIDVIAADGVRAPDERTYGLSIIAPGDIDVERLAREAWDAVEHVRETPTRSTR